MSQFWASTTGAATGAVITLTGNSGGAVSPDGSGNINIVGSGAITVTDNPGTHTLTISGTTDSSSFVTNSGTAVPVAGVLNIIDSQGTAIFTGASSTVTHKYFDASGNLVLGTLNGVYSGTNNVGLGDLAFSALTTGSANTCIGTGSGAGITTGSQNTIVGALPTSPVAGSNNIYLGYIVNTGGTDESNVCRIGQATGTGSGQLNATYIQGIYNTAITGNVVVCSSTGQLGTVVIPMGLNYIDQTTSSATMIANTAYGIDNGASLVTLTLPTTIPVGTVFQIVGYSSGGWKVAQNAGQQINFGNTPTTSGTGGSLASSNAFDCITLRCVVANTTLVAYGAQGNITVV